MNDAPDYAGFAPGVCAVLGGALQYLRSFGMPLWAATVLGGLLSVAVVWLVNPIGSDVRLYVLTGIIQAGGNALAIVGGLKGTSKFANEAVERGANPQSVFVPVSPPNPPKTGDN